MTPGVSRTTGKGVDEGGGREQVARAASLAGGGHWWRVGQGHGENPDRSVAAPREGGDGRAKWQQTRGGAAGAGCTGETKGVSGGNRHRSASAVSVAQPRRVTGCQRARDTANQTLHITLSQFPISTTTFELLYTKPIGNSFVLDRGSSSQPIL